MSFEDYERLFAGLTKSDDQSAPTPDGEWHQYGKEPHLISLDDYIADAVDRFEVDRRAYWEAYPTLSVHDAIAQDLATSLVSAVATMVQGVMGSTDVLRELGTRLGTATMGDYVRQYHALSVKERDVIDRFVHEHVQVLVTVVDQGSVEEAAYRYLELARMALAQPPRPAVGRYLARLSRTYIGGLFPETIMVCRSLVESALVDCFARHRVPLPATPSGQSSMRGRLRAAHRLQFLSANELSDAEAVWLRGNKVVHEDPTLVTDALDTVERTMRVVSALVEE